MEKEIFTKLKQDILDNLEDDAVITILSDLGSSYYEREYGGVIKFITVCHGGSHFNLKYYPETKLFHCYSECGITYNIFDLVMQVRACSFPTAEKFVAERVGIDINQYIGQKRRGFGKAAFDYEEEEEYIPPTPEEKMARNKTFVISRVEASNLPAFPDISEGGIFNLFIKDKFYEGWFEEGISIDVMEKFEIMFDMITENSGSFVDPSEGYNIIIPCRDINGNLIGVRKRRLDGIDGQERRPKYMPLIDRMAGCDYSFQTGSALYGIYQNREIIKSTKECVVFEGEKSVMKAATMYGIGNYPCTASFKQSLSTEQLALLYSIGVKKIILAYDYDSDEVFEKRMKSLKRMADYAKSVDIDLLLVADGCKEKLELKDSPIDQGKEIFEELIKNAKIIETSY